MENQNVEWENQLSMAMFNSYVRLPEGHKGGWCRGLGDSPAEKSQPWDQAHD